MIATSHTIASGIGTVGIAQPTQQVGISCCECSKISYQARGPGFESRLPYRPICICDRHGSHESQPMQSRFQDTIQICKQSFDGGFDGCCASKASVACLHVCSLFGSFSDTVVELLCFVTLLPFSAAATAHRAECHTSDSNRLGCWHALVVRISLYGSSLWNARFCSTTGAVD